MAKLDDIDLTGWTAGVNNVRNLKDLQALKALRSAVNVDIPVSGKPRRRHGFAAVHDARGHSLWAAEDWPFALLVLSLIHI